MKWIKFEGDTSKSSNLWCTGIYNGNLLLCLDAWYHKQGEIKLASTFWEEWAPSIKQAEIREENWKKTEEGRSECKREHGWRCNNLFLISWIHTEDHFLYLKHQKAEIMNPGFSLFNLQDKYLKSTRYALFWIRDFLQSVWR